MTYGADPFNVVTEPAEVPVTAGLAHPLHGRLVEKLIFRVRPSLEFEGQRDQLTWWGRGTAYYKSVAIILVDSPFSPTPRHLRKLSPPDSVPV